MKLLIQLFQQHPYAILSAASVVGTWLLNNVVTVFVSSLAAPTKDSTAKYVYWFKVLNKLVGNLTRAKSTAIEGSPNWQDAVEKATGQTPTAPAPKQP